jgi:hypothetical protein
VEDDEERPVDPKLADGQQDTLIAKSVGREALQP